MGRPHIASRGSHPAGGLQVETKVPPQSLTSPGMCPRALTYRKPQLRADPAGYLPPHPALQPPPHLQGPLPPAPPGLKEEGRGVLHSWPRTPWALPPVSQGAARVSGDTGPGARPGVLGWGLWSLGPHKGGQSPRESARDPQGRPTSRMPWCGCGDTVTPRVPGPVDSESPHRADKMPPRLEPPSAEAAVTPAETSDPENAASSWWRGLGREDSPADICAGATGAHGVAFHPFTSGFANLIRLAPGPS